MSKPENPAMILRLSVVTYSNGDEFEVIMKDGGGREVTLRGKQKISDEDFALLNTWAPACVWTKYRRETPLD